MLEWWQSQSVEENEERINRTDNKNKKSQFLPRCMECSRGIAMGILSVCLSNACIVTKRKKAMFRFLYHMKEHLS